MAYFSPKQAGCLAVTMLIVAAGVTCPLLISRHSDPFLFETPSVTAAPGALFRVSLRLTGVIRREGQAAFAPHPEGPAGGPVWSFEGAGADGVVLGGNALGLACLAPTRPGTYLLKGKFPGWFGQTLRCEVTVRAAQGLIGPALGLVSIGAGDNGRRDWTWTQVPLRQGCSATRLGDGSILVAGGWDDRANEIASTAAFRYWPALRKVQAVGPMGRHRAEAEAALLRDGRILILGGDPGNDGELFDPGSNQFQPILAAPGLWPHNCLYVLADGTVLVYPGIHPGPPPDPVQPKPCAYLLDPRTQVWQNLGAVAQPRETPTVTGLPDGKVLVVGAAFDPMDPEGFRSPDPALLTEIYDPASREFHPGPAALHGRRAHKALLLNDGKVLVCGGWSSRYRFTGAGGTVPERHWEVFDPSLGAFKELSTVQPVDPGPALALPDGSVLYCTGGRMQRESADPVRRSTLFPPRDLLAPDQAVSLSDGSVLLLGPDPLLTQIFYP